MPRCREPPPRPGDPHDARDAFGSRIPALVKSSICGKDYDGLKGTNPGSAGDLVDAIRAEGLTVLNGAR
ncbi:hypothetical protein WJ438_04415 [Streptomyces sp. GD-15H]|uniref:hypothetical protein n=1 Tax=Streptomyces sp. GD-15H TaxID=3129112 RepID=UPI003251CA42